LPISARLIRSLPHPDRKANLTTVRFTPAGTLFVAGYPSGVVQVWDVATGKELRRVESPRGYRGNSDYALTPADCKTLWVPIDGRKATRTQDAKNPWQIDYKGHLLRWDPTTGQALATFPVSPGRGPLRAEVSPDGTRLVTVERAGYRSGEEGPPDETRLYDTATGKSSKLGDGYGMVAFSADSQRFYLSLDPNRPRKAGTLTVHDRDGKRLATLGELQGEAYSSPTLSADGKRLVVTSGKGRINEPGAVRVFDLTAGKEIAHFPSGGDYPFMQPALSPDGRLAAASDYDGKVTVWDVAKRSVVLHYKREGMRFGWNLTFEATGKRLAVPASVKTDGDRDRDPDPLDFPQPRVFLFDLTQPRAAPRNWSARTAGPATWPSLPTARRSPSAALGRCICSRSRRRDKLPACPTLRRGQAGRLFRVVLGQAASLSLRADISRSSSRPGRGGTAAGAGSRPPATEATARCRPCGRRRGRHRGRSL
jgi:DNA-binding beta-propeller fold protein YncE